ncbi:MAG: STAS/SEC14 domain-containing protein [Opitutaceae bacterium]|nr:STAS/SEC14 domain-containing protein [Opitutaceae bacterium]
MHIAWQGDVTKEDLVSIGKLLPKLAATLGFAPDVLHTFAEMNGPDFTPWTAFEHSLRQETVRLRNAAKSAVVAKNPQVQAVARMMQALNRNPNIAMEIFASEELALAWLRDE